MCTETQSTNECRLGWVARKFLDSISRDSLASATSETLIIPPLTLLCSHIRYKFKVDKVNRAVYADSVVIIVQLYTKLSTRLCREGWLLTAQSVSTRGSVGKTALFCYLFWRKSRGLTPCVQAQREGWRSRLLGLSSPAHTPTRRCPHGLSKHKGNDRLGQSFLPGYEAPWDPLRRTEAVCGAFFCWEIAPTVLPLSPSV
jgi:hypothetical protein